MFEHVEKSYKYKQPHKIIICKEITNIKTAKLHLIRLLNIKYELSFVHIAKIFTRVIFYIVYIKPAAKYNCGSFWFLTKWRNTRNDTWQRAFYPCSLAGFEGERVILRTRYISHFDPPTPFRDSSVFLSLSTLHRSYTPILNLTFPIVGIFIETFKKNNLPKLLSKQLLL